MSNYKQLRNVIGRVEPTDLQTLISKSIAEKMIDFADGKNVSVMDVDIGVGETGSVFFTVRNKVK